MIYDPICYASECGAHVEAQPARDCAYVTFAHDEHGATFTLAVDEEQMADLRARFAAHAAKVRGGGSLDQESIVIFGDSYRFTAHDASEIVRLLDGLGGAAH